MDQQELEATLSLLLQDMEGEWGDRHEIHMRLRQTLDGMRAMGMPLPDDLVRMERDLAAEFAADQSNGDKAG
ncbi:MAG: hypothetical protein V3R98_00120 [Alphaproteobacteria bacterium]